MPEIFAQYHQLYPQVQISIYRNFSRKVLEKLEDSTIDVGIVTLPVKSRSLRVHSIFRDKLMLMVSTKNPLAKKKAVTRSDVAEQPLILPKTGFTRQLLDRYFRPYRSRLRITMELPSVTMIKRFVAANLGVSLISRSYALEEVRSGEVKLIPSRISNCGANSASFTAVTALWPGPPPPSSPWSNSAPVSTPSPTAPIPPELRRKYLLHILGRGA